MSLRLVCGIIFLLSNSSVGQQLGNPICLDEVVTNEPSLSIDSNNPAYQIIGSNVDLYFISSDTGRTWKQKKLNSTMGVYGDPVVKIAESGRYYYAHLSKNAEKTYPNMFDRIVFHFSDNKGEGFTNGVGIGKNGSKMQDKPWFHVFSPDPSDPNKDIIALSWTEFDEYKSPNPTDSARIMFAISKNGGLNFSDPITLSTKQGSCEDNSLTPEGATPIILPDGSVHVVWSMNDLLYYNRSTDWGKTWQGEKVIEKHVGGWSIEKEGFMRTNAMPFLSSGKNNELYLTWGDSRKKSHQIYFMKSTNAGETWEKPQQITSLKNLKKSHGEYFLPFVSVDKHTGHIFIIYYERATHIKAFCEVGIAWSTDNGESFSNTYVSASPFLTAGKKVFFGDYNSVDASHGFVRTVWTSHSQELVFLCSNFFKDSELSKNKVSSPVLITDSRKGGEHFVYFFKGKTRKWKGVLVVNGKKVESFEMKKKLLEFEWKLDNSLWSINDNVEVVFTSKGKEIKVQIQ